MAEPLDTWFRREILIHEASLMRFLGHAWPYRDEHADIRQEAYVRVYAAALQAVPSNPRAFLFAIARHIMADRRRRERVVSIQAAGDSDFSNDLVDEQTPERSLGARQELLRLTQAFDRLPAKCREVFWMRRVQDLSQREVAQQLGVSENTIEKQICRAARLLAQYIREFSSELPPLRHEQRPDVAAEENNEDLK
ncbi:RNA polymerase sigma factor [Steroidobacter sp.]|uniref:RNA polymerase sigma factor n=1 Tax=Steroidobacter sp. TaxID=1978227 RepID=UPI001A4E60FD|nr:sigma-70 family RNA polymerase sigma factor [Steroidobacter sp.]MBL8271990.1 sigma-70 family RNA polymerase sigma factor [Steroidobacter sp.]